MNKIILAGIIAGIIIIGSMGMYLSLNYKPQVSTPYEIDKEIFTPKNVTTLDSKDLIKFTSYDEVKNYLIGISNQQYGPSFGDGIRKDFREGGPIIATPSSGPAPTVEPRPSLPPNVGTNDEEIPESGSPISDHDYSTTNVQVKNVDEPDYVKNDGKYIYIVYQNNLSIIDAYPAKDSKLILKTALDIEQQNLENIFLNGDKLVVFYYGSGQTYGIAEYDYAPYPVYSPKTFATIIDVSDRQNPKTVTKFEVDGSYTNSRMIGDTIYLLTTSGVDYYNPIIPRVMAGTDLIMPDVYRFPNPEPSYQFNTVTAFDVSGTMKNSETFLMGYANTIYVSENNLYITYQKNMPYNYYDNVRKDRFFVVVVPLLPQDAQDKIKQIQIDPTLDAYSKWNLVSQVLQDTYNELPKDQKESLFTKIQRALEEYDTKASSESQKTVIHKISLDNGNLKYIANTEVPGYMLNQFSMDEKNEKLRVATTSQYFSRDRNFQSNNVFVLDSQLHLVGKLDKIAPDERIYSARFMDDKLYLVTFKQVDPFFVIDLSSDTPKILGALKIPGFSNYLQPYDDTHIIGIGRDTKENPGGGVTQNGVKVSMFDVSDFEHPKETDTIVIGTSSTDSEILYNHKALLLDKEKNIMTIPIKSNYGPLFESDTTRPDYYSKNWNGFYVYSFSNNKFVEEGTIPHHIWENNYNPVYMQSRALYIGDTLYTIMDGTIKMNEIGNISNEINTIELSHTGEIIKYLDKK